MVERGIGEVRAALIEGGTLRAIRIDPDDDHLRVGAVVAVRLVERSAVPGLLLALTHTGRELLVRGAAGALGTALTVRVVREALPERGRAKRSIALPHDGPPAPAPSLDEELAATGTPVRLLHPHEPDALEASGWSERLEEAATGELVRPGCTLRLSLTPAMTLIDADGSDPADALAETAARSAAEAIRLFDLGGSIGLDLPSAGSKAARRAVGDALDRALPAPFERTAMNGFGFVQIVRPRMRASVPEMLAADPVGHSLRAALRRAEREPPGRPLTLRLPHSQAERLTQGDWLTERERRRGATVAVRRAESGSVP